MSLSFQQQLHFLAICESWMKRKILKWLKDLSNYHRRWATQLAWGLLCKSFAPVSWENVGLRSAFSLLKLTTRFLVTFRPPAWCLGILSSISDVGKLCNTSWPDFSTPNVNRTSSNSLSSNTRRAFPKEYSGRLYLFPLGCPERKKGNYKTGWLTEEHSIKTFICRSLYNFYHSYLAQRSCKDH